MAPPKFKNFCFTSYEPEMYNGEYPSSVEKIEYQQEIAPTTGKKHWQGYVLQNSYQRMNHCQRIVGGKPHIEKMKGKPVDNQFYCSKAETSVPGTHFVWEKEVQKYKPTCNIMNLIGIKRDRCESCEQLRDEHYEEFMNLVNAIDPKSNHFKELADKMIKRQLIKEGESCIIKWDETEEPTPKN